MREADMQCPLPLQKVTQLEGLMAATPREREAEQPVDERLQRRTRTLAGIKTRITSIESQFATAVEKFDEVFDAFVKRTDLLREALAKEEASQQKEERGDRRPQAPGASRGAGRGGGRGPCAATSISTPASASRHCDLGWPMFRCDLVQRRCRRTRSGGGAETR